MALGLPQGARVLDVGTGSGAVALALKDERPDLAITASDVSRRALEVARANAERLGLDVAFVQSHLLDGIEAEFDAIVSNPPYIADADRALLAPEITRHEPALGLFAGPDGLELIRDLIPRRGERTGWLALEIGAGQADAVAALMQAPAYTASIATATWPGIERVLVAAPMITAADADPFERCIHVHGVALFPADTVYGLACEPGSDEAVRRLYRLKGRPPNQPAAIMFFSLDLAVAALPELGRRTRAALEHLLPGGVTLLVANPARRFPLACGPDPDTLGVRVPALPDALAPLHTVRWPVLQSSANRSGEPAPRRLADVPETIRAEVDCGLDGGALPGTASTVVDLRSYERDGRWAVVRAGAVGGRALVRVLGVGALRDSRLRAGRDRPGRGAVLVALLDDGDEAAGEQRAARNGGGPCPPTRGRRAPRRRAPAPSALRAPPRIVASPTRSWLSCAQGPPPPLARPTAPPRPCSRSTPSPSLRRPSGSRPIGARSARP